MVDAFRFITEGDAHTIVAMLQKTFCKPCRGTGELDDAELGDLGWNTWACPDCGGTGWDKQAVRELIAAVDLDD